MSVLALVVGIVIMGCAPDLDDDLENKMTIEIAKYNDVSTVQNPSMFNYVNIPILKE